MSIMIKISEKTEDIIREKADRRGKNINDFLGEFVESSFSEPEQNGGRSHEKNEPHPLLRMAGKYSSGVSDTSERMHEILYSENLDPAQGFGTDK